MTINCEQANTESTLQISDGEANQSSSRFAYQSPVDKFEGTWWLVHTRPRHEKALAANLDNMGISYLLPLVRCPRRYSGRTTTVDIPLFPSYLFLCGSEGERHAALTTNRVANIIDVFDQERLKGELRHIHHLTSSDQQIDLYPGLRVGRRCRVARGSLKGLEGVVLRRRGTSRIYVGVEILGQSAELEINPGLLEVVERRANR